MITYTAGARSYKQPQDSVVGSLKEVWTQDDGTVRRSERKNRLLEWMFQVVTEAQA